MAVHVNGEDHDCFDVFARLGEGLLVGIVLAGEEMMMGGSVNDEGKPLLLLDDVVDGRFLEAPTLYKKSKLTTSLRNFLSSSVITLIHHPLHHQPHSFIISFNISYPRGSVLHSYIAVHSLHTATRKMYRPRPPDNTWSPDTASSDPDPVESLTDRSSSTRCTPSPSRPSTAESPEASTSWTSTGQSSSATEQSSSATGHSPVTLTYQARRFYQHSSSLSQNPLRDPDEQHDQARTMQRAALEESRAAALFLVNECFQHLTVLEVTRMTAARGGTFAWLRFWDRVYTREVFRPLNRMIVEANRKVDTLFRERADRIRVLIYQRYNYIRIAATQAQIDWELQILEEYLPQYRDRRRRKAQRIMNKLQTNLWNGLGIRITPGKMDELKSDLFGMLPNCDYDPEPRTPSEITASLPSTSTSSLPQLVFDPTLDRHRPHLLFFNGEWMEIPPGYRPADGYVMDPARLV